MSCTLISCVFYHVHTIISAIYTRKRWSRVMLPIASVYRVHNIMVFCCVRFAFTKATYFFSDLIALELWREGCDYFYRGYTIRGNPKASGVFQRTLTLGTRARCPFVAGYWRLSRMGFDDKEELFSNCRSNRVSNSPSPPVYNASPPSRRHSLGSGRLCPVSGVMQPDVVDAHSGLWPGVSRHKA